MIKVTKAQVVAEAREWLHTPFHHQASVKGVGCDCLGLVRGVRSKFFPWLDEGSLNYARLPNGDVLYKTLCNNEILSEVPKSELAPADVILFTFVRNPQHVGFYTFNNTVIHAYAGSTGVVEHRLDDKWRNRIHAVFRINGLSDD